MSTQDPHNQGDTKETVEKKRRQFIKGAGLATPVILTLSSPSVFGAAGLCLSQMLSGNQSHAITPNCTLGHSPGYWVIPANYSLWPSDINAGTLPTGSANVCGNYSNGTTFHSIFGANPTTAGGSSTTTMLSILCRYSTSLDAYLVAAYLNADTPGSDYLLTTTQVVGMVSGNPPFSVPPGYASLQAFLQSTMNPSPG